MPASDRGQNACADNLAGCLHKPKVAGSDAHKMRVVGAAYTEFTQKLQTTMI